MTDKWMQDAVKPSHEGKFSAKAKRAGMSTAAYATKEQHAPGALGKEARLARVFAAHRPGNETAHHHPQANYACHAPN
jgi:hypothetical protein